MFIEIGGAVRLISKLRMLHDMDGYTTAQLSSSNTFEDYYDSACQMSHAN